jgi:hypothetical protein
MIRGKSYYVNQYGIRTGGTRYYETVEPIKREDVERLFLGIAIVVALASVTIGAYWVHDQVFPIIHSWLAN